MIKKEVEEEEVHGSIHSHRSKESIWFFSSYVTIAFLSILRRHVKSGCDGSPVRYTVSDSLQFNDQTYRILGLGLVVSLYLIGIPPAIIWAHMRSEVVDARMVEVEDLSRTKGSTVVELIGLNLEENSRTCQSFLTADYMSYFDHVNKHLNTLLTYL